jgi:hypothetical protein
LTAPPARFHCFAYEVFGAYSLVVTIQPIIAVWGAITGTLALCIQLTNYWRDRAIVGLNPIHQFSTDIKNPAGRLVFIIEVVNHGRRSVYLEDAGIEMPPPKNPPPGTWGHKSTLNIFPPNAGGSIHIGEGQKIRIIQDPFLPEFGKALGEKTVCYVRDT